VAPTERSLSLSLAGPSASSFSVRSAATRETEEPATVARTCLAVLGSVLHSLASLAAHWAALAAAAGAEFDAIGLYEGPEGAAAGAYTGRGLMASPQELAAGVGGVGALLEADAAALGGSRRSSPGRRGTRPTALPRAGSRGRAPPAPLPRGTRASGPGAGASGPPSPASASAGSAPLVDMEAAAAWRGLAQRAKSVAKVCVVVLKQEGGVVLPQHRLEALQVGGHLAAGALPGTACCYKPKCPSRPRS
jgi:hypothetical protein